MSKSLQDQLLSLGLAQKKPAPKQQKRTARPPTRPAGKGAQAQRKTAPGQARSEAGMEIDLARAYALRKKEEQQQAEMARKRKQEQDRIRRQLNLEIGAIVKAHRLNDANAEISRNFMYKGRIRKIHLTPEQLIAVNRGELGVAYMSGGYHLLALEHVDAIRQLSVDHVPDLGGAAIDDDDEHPVPDDLVW